MPLDHSPVMDVWLRRRDLNPQPLAYETSALIRLSYSAMMNFGGPGRTRTCVPLFRRQMLSFPLSYKPARVLEAMERFAPLSFLFTKETLFASWSYIAMIESYGRGVRRKLRASSSSTLLRWQSTFCPDEPRPEKKWSPVEDSNLRHSVRRTDVLAAELTGEREVIREDQMSWSFEFIGGREWNRTTLFAFSARR